MDGAQARYLYSTVCELLNNRGRVEVRERSTEALAVKRRGGAFSVDLGGSSKYSDENTEGRSGLRFDKKCCTLSVSRS